MNGRVPDPAAPVRRPDVGDVIDRETSRWRGIAAVALLTASVGALLGTGAPLVAGAVGLALAAYAKGADPPEVDLAVERAVSRHRAEPGDEVQITLTVRNVGDGTLPDLRVVDGVPEGLAVREGSPRHGTALRPGKAASFTYGITARRGEHEWGAVTVLARDASGAMERETTLAGPETSLTCIPGLAKGEPLPLRQQTTRFTGRVSADTTGDGLEFRSVREYRRGDPLGRVDWNRVAKTGEFATVEYAQERAASVVLVVDAREEAYVAPSADGVSAVERSVEAAGEAFTSLLSTGDPVGLAAFGPRECWLPPGSGEDHRARARALLATSEAFTATPPEEAFVASLELRRLRRRLPGGSQVVFCSPVVDDFAVNVARRLEAYGHLVTVVSPDPTSTGTAGRDLARAERALRLSELRRAGLHVIDWGDGPLGAAVDRAGRRWSA